MLKRKIYNELLTWKTKSSGQTAMMIDGARRVGKSYIAELFGRQEYKSYTLIRLKKNTENIIIPSEEEHIELYPPALPRGCFQVCRRI